MRIKIIYFVIVASLFSCVRAENIKGFVVTEKDDTIRNVIIENLEDIEGVKSIIDDDIEKRINDESKFITSKVYYYPYVKIVRPYQADSSYIDSTRLQVDVDLYNKKNRLMEYEIFYYNSSNGVFEDRYIPDFDSIFDCFSQRIVYQ